MAEKPGEESEEVVRERVRRRTKKALIIAAVVFSAYVIHLYLATGGISFITNILKGDLVQITSLILTTFTIVGWVIIFRLFRKIP